MAQSSMCEGFLENVTKVIIPFSSLALDSHPYETIEVCPHWKVQHRIFTLPLWFDLMTTLIFLRRIAKEIKLAEDN